MTLERGGRVPHVVVRRSDGTTFTYGDIWQKRNLVLIRLGPEVNEDEERLSAAAWIRSLLSHDETLRQYDTEVVITRDPVPGLPPLSILVADRWGEIAAVEPFGRADSPLSVEDILEELRFVAHACPECEGEAR